MAAILMTSLLGPDAELRWANWFKLLHMTQSLFWYRSPKIVTKFTRDAHSTYTTWLFTLGNIGTVLPAKSDSDVKFCLQSYQGLMIDRSLVYQSNPQDRINTQLSDLSICVSSSEVYTLVFYLAIVNKVLCHCHS